MLLLLLLLSSLLLLLLLLLLLYRYENEYVSFWRYSAGQCTVSLGAASNAVFVLHNVTVT